MVYAVTKQENIDLVIISEPNINIATKKGFIMKKENDVAVHIANKNIGITGHALGEGFVKLQFRHFIMLCCYCSPNITPVQSQTYIDKIMNEVKDAKEAIIAGDLNAKSPLWGSPSSDQRGNYIEDWAAELQMEFLNTGEPTFVRGNNRTHIDVMCATKKTAEKIKSWKTMDQQVNTSHKYITFEIQNNDCKQRQKKEIKQLDTNLLVQNIARDLKITYNSTHEIIAALEKVTKKSMKNRTTETKNEIYWWNDDISEKRQEAIRARRKKTRLSRRLQAKDPELLAASEEAASLRKQLTKKINNAKKTSLEECM